MGNYPDIQLKCLSHSRVATEWLAIVKKFYPGEIKEDAELVIQWGQKLRFEDGKNTIVFDCGYFDREIIKGRRRHYRFSINERHPKQLPAAEGDRWKLLNRDLQNYYNPEGPIILVGRGGKTREYDKYSTVTNEKEKQAVTEKSKHGLTPVWEREALRKLKKKYPGVPIIYRPKRRYEELPGTVTDWKSPIINLCKGARLIYTQRSNVGNEGILYGVPVVSEDGPAVDVCPTSLPDEIKPLPYDVRLDFLHRLAYWQWSLDEIRRGDIWPWLFKQLETR